MIDLLVKSLTARKMGFAIVFIIVPAFFFYLISIVAMQHYGFDLAEILKEPPMITGTSSLLGFVSNIGNFLWVASFSICFFAIYARGEELSYQHKELLFLTGFFSFVLCIDDFFMIHDLYVNQYLCYGIYAISALALLGRHYRSILEINGLIFFIGCFFLGLSVFTDGIQDLLPFDIRMIQFFEEGFKFIGITGWLFFSVSIASWKSDASPVNFHIE